MEFTNEAGQRLKQLRVLRKFSQDEAGKAINYDKRSIYTWEVNRTRPKKEILRVLVETILGGYLDWVLTGEGEMLSRPLTIQQVMRSKIPLISEEIKNKKGYPFNQNPSTKPGQVKDKPGANYGHNNVQVIKDWGKEANKVPLYEISAGWDYIKSCEYPMDMISVASKTEESFALKISGESMAPKFKPGEVIVLNPIYSIKSWSGCAAYFLKNGDAGFKKVVIEDGTATLIPLNPKYKPLKINQDDIEQLCELIWHHKKYGKG